MNSLQALKTLINETTIADPAHPNRVIVDATLFDELLRKLEEPVAPPRGTETQHTIMQWIVDTFGGTITPYRAALRSLEEMIELCVEVGVPPVVLMMEVKKYAEVAAVKSKGVTAAPEEMADVYITLCHLALALRGVKSTFGHPIVALPVNIQEEVDAKMLVNRGRTWAHDGKGSGQHVEAQ